MQESINPWAKWVSDAEEQQKKEKIRAGEIVDEDIIDPKIRKIKEEQKKNRNRMLK